MVQCLLPVPAVRHHCSARAPVYCKSTGQRVLVGCYGIWPMLQGVCSELALVDVMADRLLGEHKDLADGQAFLSHRVTILSGTGTS